MAREHLADERSGYTHKVTIGGMSGFITANENDDGQLKEVFFHGFGLMGSTMQGWTDSFGILLSYALQHGVSLSELAVKYAHMRFPPNGETDNPDIPRCYSVPDYIFRWLAHHYGDDELREALAAIDAEMERKPT